MLRDRWIFVVALLLGALVGGALLWPGSPLARMVGAGEERELVLRVDNVGATPITARVEIRDEERAVARLTWEAPPGRSERTLVARVGSEAFAWGRFSGAEGQGDLLVELSPAACPRTAALLVGWEVDPTRGISVQGSTVGCVAE